MIIDDHVYPWQNEVPLRITALEMKRVMFRFASDFNPIDISYRCPPEKWLVDVAGEVYKQKSFDNGLRAYHVEDWDCDERAMLYCTVARAVHRNELWAPFCGLAVGLVSYLVNGDIRSGHAICWAVADRGGKPVVVFVDPGDTPALVTLTEKEQKTLNRFYI